MRVEFLRVEEFSRWLGQMTQPTHPYYFSAQLLLFSGLSYLSTACLTSIPPVQGMAFMTIAFTISHFVAPLFAKWLEPYWTVSLVPLAGQILHLTTSALLSKAICFLAGYHLTLTQIAQVSSAFLVAVYVLKFALLKFRQLYQFPSTA
ncbi:hypothetical protein [Candidatus Protochlamydia phocaeensis]|uniref:hypothetical protein n=1 Tax=Candidatus Protochlamydia phocaeensis TaxID=1414722 RepID=UPI0008384958|nr:hypothetical protein [Candidatus Protochlamydia phocaeensis]